MLQARFVEGVREVPREQWDRLAAASPSPFLEWTFLAAVEAASATPEHGFLPQHLTLWQDERLVAACPLYVKGDGRAEFIYDYQWWMLADRVKVPYYPKAVSMIPVTPAVFDHLLVDPARDAAPLRRTLVSTVEDWAQEAGLTGVHWLFLPEREAELLGRSGHVRRETAQLAISNPGWRDLDDFLSGFRSKHRIKLRREMRRPEEQGLEIETVEGDELGEEHLDAMYRFYLSTVEAHGTGSHYLKRESWERLFADWSHRLLLCFARDGQRRVAGSFCVQGGGELYGRYWGADGDWPSLYFNLTCFAPLRALIERGGTRFWAGFGNAPHKHARGFEPVTTHSAHRHFHPGFHSLLEQWLEHERPAVREDLTAAAERSRRRR